MKTTDTQLAEFVRRRRRAAARLKRVNRQLSALDEYEAAAEMPEDIRPVVPKPELGRAVLKALQRMLVDVNGEIEEAWERRN